ncbi:unnamed protein product [marine sediment metagenome]|uniref:Uncharacterized protein n=1 Tax=marine sediment metagenome TaxID=412755 RepID=X1GB92_9ZZZZ
MHGEIITAFTDGLASIQADVITLLIVVIPVAIAIFGIIFAIRFAKRGFRTISR